MNREMNFLAAALAAAMLSACGGGGKQQAATEEPGAATETPVAVLAPVKIDYRIIGTPVVGQPVTIDLKVKSNVGDTPVTLSYETNDSTAMMFAESQQRMVSLAFVDDERTSAQQVTVIPLREGRLFLNVTAHMQTDTGSLQTVVAVPIQVSAAPRELQENGVVTTDESGDLIREMPASND
jgi:hypothetical protein